MSKREDVSNRYLASGFHNSGIESTMARMIGKDVQEKVQYCAECGEPCSPGYSPVQDSPTVYCKIHYEKLFASKCEGCNQPIVGEFMNSNGKKYHVQCAPEGSRCERCRQPIFGSTKYTSSKAYHPKCFTCSSCNKLLSGEFTDLKGSPFCSNCANEVTLSRSGIPGVSYESEADREKREQAKIQNELYHNVQAGKEVCNWCRKVAGIDAVSFSGRYFHPDCFVCGSCGENIGKGTFTDVGGVAHCDRCSPKAPASSSSSSMCTGCRQPISGSHVTALQGNKYHPQCLKCTQCDTVLKGGFAAKAGKVVCANCASAKAPAPTVAHTGERRSGFVIDPRSGKKTYM
eukprot:Phypoly_transcript_12023.p1 GENE.Phypoly_transcript_12023~~Phypoly_transcript_12023.p1  ORF type:complete len:345 (+),score=30.09 Phypoly_transcript_12023:61-1095(+)